MIKNFQHIENNGKWKDLYAVLRIESCREFKNSINTNFLQSYLNEFCYKFNRRYFSNPMERPIIAGTNHRWNKF